MRIWFFFGEVQKLDRSPKSLKRLGCLKVQVLQTLEKLQPPRDTTEMGDCGC